MSHKRANGHEPDAWVDCPPKLTLRDDGREAVEHVTLVGWVYFPLERDEKRQARLMRDLGLCLDHASVDELSGRWEQVLFSEPAADMLMALDVEEKLPFHFVAGPSVGGLAWIEAESRSLPAPPGRPLRDYLTPASAGELDRAALESEPTCETVPSHNIRHLKRIGRKKP